MTYKIDWDVPNIKHQLRRMYSECTSPYNTGWNSWPIKQDLYEIKFLLDDLINNAGNFAGEEEWLNQKEQEKIIQILKR